MKTTKLFKINIGSKRFPGFFSSCFFSYVGYNYAGGKELIEAKIKNINAETELKLSQARKG